MKIDMKHLRLLAAVVLVAGGTVAHATPASSYYIYDEQGHVIGEYDANGDPVQEHVYLGDRPVAVVQGGGSGTVSYVSTDQLTTPRVITDSSQTVLWTWNSDPFANGSPTGALTYNLRFPGQYADAETGHYYNYFRDYDATVGRYIEADPTDIDGGINVYAYADSRPLVILDPSGLIPRPGSIRYVPCSGDELSACQSMCAAQGKTMESCRRVEMWKVLRARDTKAGWFGVVRGWKKINVSCSCNEPNQPNFCQIHPAACAFLSISLGIAICGPAIVAPTAIPAL